MHLERLRKIAGAKIGRDVPHVGPDLGDRGGIGAIVAVQHDATAIREVFEHMMGAVLIDAHDLVTARLHRREDHLRLLFYPR